MQAVQLAGGDDWPRVQPCAVAQGYAGTLHQLPQAEPATVERDTIVESQEPSTEGEVTPTDGTIRPPLPCKFCQVPVVQPKRWDTERHFCSDRHRTAYHALERRKAVLAILAGLEDLEDELDRLRATVAGSRERIAATLPKERRRKPVGPTPT